MKKSVLVLSLFALAGTLMASAQKKESNPKMWEESQARKVVPEIRTFVTPQICDMQMLSNERQEYGPYYFPIKSVEDTFNFDLENYKSRAHYRAVQESDADAIIEPLFNCYVYENDVKTLVVELSGYPVKYVNFRPATDSEVNMIGVIYPYSNNAESRRSSVPPTTTTTKNGK